jgi:putative ABC transport system substrate-binding protein
MKNTMKKIVSVFAALLMAASLAACAGGAPSASSAAPSASSAAPSASASGAAGKSYKIGVIQYAPHPSLDNCYTGFKAGLEEAGLKEGTNLTIDFQNAQGDTSNSDLIAKNMVSKKYDLIMAIATPSAMSAYSAAKDADIPVVFTAVSDPVAAGIVKAIDKPDTNCTGSSDVLPLEQQVKMIRAFLPEAKKIGILYTTSEPNSVSQLKEIKDLAPKYGFEIVDVGVTNASEVASGAQTLVAKGVDCINNFTDNNVVNNLSSLLQAANSKNIPVFGSEEEQVKNGCAASQSIDYVALGKETGKMAAQILTGQAKAADLAVYQVKECTPVYNNDVLTALGLKLPADYANATAVTPAVAKN